jgi:hypothetical protein
LSEPHDEPVLDPEAADDDDDDEDEPPRVVLGRVGDVRSWLSPQLAHKHRDRPIWFVLAMDEDFVGIFERIPEGPMPPQESSSILSGLREMAADESDRLQEWLGPTDSIVFGFHTSATLGEVRKAFEDDGFLVVGTLREGRVEPTVPPE